MWEVAAAILVVGTSIIITLIKYGANITSQISLMVEKNRIHSKNIDVLFDKNEKSNNRIRIVNTGLTEVSTKISEIEKYQKNLHQIPSIAMNINEIKKQVQQTNGSVQKNTININTIFKELKNIKKH